MGYVRAATTTDRNGWFVDWATQGRKSSTGISVTPAKALTLPVFYACLRNIAEDIGKLPVSVFRRNGDSREKLPDHPVTALLNRQPNSEQIAMRFRSAIQAHSLSWGNGYAEIQRDIAGRPVALWPLRPDRVRPFRDKNSKELWYEVTNDAGGIIKLHNSIVLHIAGLGFDGIMGYNIVKMARESIGLGLATEQFGGTFFANGANAGGAFTHPGELGDVAHKNLKRQIAENREGLENAHKTIILEEGMKFESFSIPPNEAQFLETRQFSVPEICRWFRMPPHIVQDLNKATFSNIEHQSLEYVKFCLSTWLVLWEQTTAWKLLSQKERDDGLYIRHNVEALLRGDIRTRTESYSKGRMGGWLSVNDIRAMEEQNPLPDDDGDIYLQPLNMRDVAEDEPVDPPPAPPTPPGNEDQDRTDAMIADCALRIHNHELAELTKHVPHAKDDSEKFAAWAVEFYEKHEAYVAKVISPLGLFDSVFIQECIEFRLNAVVYGDAEEVLSALREAGPISWEKQIRKAIV